MFWKLATHIAFAVSIATAFFGIGLLVEAADHWKDIRRRSLEAAAGAVVMLVLTVALLIFAFR